MTNEERKEIIERVEKKMDWHLFWMAASTVVVLSSIILGCYVSLKTELTTIKTVLLIRGIMPPELAVHQDR